MSRWIPLVAAALVVLGVAVAGSRIVISAQASAEDTRIAERAALTTRTAANTFIANGQQIVPAVNALPWSLTDPARDQALLTDLKNTPAFGDPVLVLARPDGTIIARVPPGVTPPLGPGSPEWNSALAGTAATTNTVYSAGAWRVYNTVPILRGGRPAAILILGVNLRKVYSEAAFIAIGGLGTGSGGFSAVDRAGRAALSWNPALIGKPLVPAASLPKITRGQRISTPNSTGLVTIAAAPPGRPAPGVYVILQQPTSAFFRDIRVGWLSRDLGLLLLVALTIGALTVLDARRERTARQAEARLAVLLHSAHDIFVVIDDHQHITFVSSAVGNLLGWDSAELVGSDIVALVHPDDRERLLAFALTVRETGSEAIRDIRLRATDGTYRWFDVDAIDLTGNRYVRGALATCHETSDRKELADELAYRAGHDPLTGLANRAHFTRRLDTIAAADTGARFAVLFVDLDDFKPVNDTYGHAAGDEVLRVLGARLQAAGRDADLVCRLGGDEFALLLTDIDEDAARHVAARLLDVIRGPITVAGTVIQIDATIGIAIATTGAQRPEAVVRDADRAMYQGKESGRGRFVIA
ncbi:MAG: diguanylate cyclase domain-containing protein [Frankia sp.]